MTATLTPTVEPQAGNQVTAAEIAQIERQLLLIDRRNFHLSQATKWLFIWQEVRHLCHRFGTLAEKDQAELKECLRSLLSAVIALGDDLSSRIDALQISDQHFFQVTNCERGSFRACISYLQDQQEIWFGSPLDCAAVLKSVGIDLGNEPIGPLSASL